MNIWSLVMSVKNTNLVTYGKGERESNAVGKGGWGSNKEKLLGSRK